MIGAIVGDIVGSKYEFNNLRSVHFPLFSSGCFATDDSIMTLAVAKAIKMGYEDMAGLSQNAIKCMQNLGKKNLCCGFGGRFFNWILQKEPLPYRSLGNGAAMRISPVGWATDDIALAVEMSNAVTRVSHNHPEGLKGAESVTVAIELARSGKSKDEIREHILENYYKIDFTLDEIRWTNRFDETCPVTVPQAFEVFFESENFEDTIRKAISIGGDSDTIAAIAGAVAEAYYGVPKKIEEKALTYLDDEMLQIYESCREWNFVI